MTHAKYIYIRYRFVLNLRILSSDLNDTTCNLCIYFFVGGVLTISRILYVCTITAVIFTGNWSTMNKISLFSLDDNTTNEIGMHILAIIGNHLYSYVSN